MKKRPDSDRLRIVLSLLAVLAVMAVIFAFSAAPAEESDQSSGVIVGMILKWFFPDFPTLSAERQLALEKTCSHIVRKCAHFCEYALLGFTLALHVSAVARVRKPRLGYGGAVLVGALYAASDELHQLFVPGRAAMIGDVLIDALGAAFGTAFFLLCRRLFTRRRTHDSP